MEVAHLESNAPTGELIPCHTGRDTLDKMSAGREGERPHVTFSQQLKRELHTDLKRTPMLHA